MATPRFEDLVKQGGKVEAAPSTPAPAAVAPRFEDLARTGRVEAPPAQPQGPSALEAASRGYAQGGTFGFADELSGALQAGFDRYLTRAGETLGGKVVANPIDELEKLKRSYVANRDAIRREEARIKEAHPLAYGVGDVAGGMAIGAALPVSRLSSIAQGAASGLGQSESESLGGDVASTFLGGALGNVGHDVGRLAGGAIGKYLAPRISGAAQSARKALQERAEISALKAAGAIQKDITAMAQRDPSKVYQTGRTLLNEGVIEPFAGVEQVGKSVDAAKKVVNDLRVAALNEADASGQKFDFGRFAKRVYDEIILPNKGDPAVRREIEAVQNIVNEYLETAAEQGAPTFARANQLKSNLQNAKINWGNDWNLNGPSKFLAQFQMALQGIMHEEIDDQIGEAAGGATKAAFQAAKQRFGPLIYASDRARQGFAREIGNDFLGIKDMQAAQTALMASAGRDLPTSASGLAIAAGSALFNKYARSRGSSTVAWTANKAAKSDWLQQLVATTPEAFGEYGRLLSEAAARGPGALAVKDYVLSQQDPAYRQKKEAAQKEMERGAQ